MKVGEVYKNIVTGEVHTVVKVDETCVWFDMENDVLYKPDETGHYPFLLAMMLDYITDGTLQLIEL